MDTTKFTNIYKTNKDIIKASKKLAKKLNDAYKDKEDIVWITIMTGGIHFSSELMKHTNFNIQLDFINASSYHEFKKISETKVNYFPLKINLNDKNIILVDDIIDTGSSMKAICDFINKEYNVKSICQVAMWGKPIRLKTKYDEYFAFSKAPEEFVVGFGLDIKGYYRNLPYVAIINKED